MKNESKIWLVVTSINKPTVAIQRFSRLAKAGLFNVVVVGDTKTPLDWKCDGIDFLSINQQRSDYGALASLIPEKHYCRKNLGYLYALSRGAEIIIDTDDDNIPYNDFGQNISLEASGKLIGNSKWINIYSQYTDAVIWPRGLPLDEIYTKGDPLDHLNFECPIQQFLADDDPDVDAIFRLINKTQIKFNAIKESTLVDFGTYVPFNSQNTIYFKQVCKLLYLPCFVSFRMTDIWRSFVAQRVLHSFGKRLCFKNATVYQTRNSHNLIKDFADEIDGYIHNKAIVTLLDSIVFNNDSNMSSRILLCWKTLQEKTNLIPQKELDILNLWLEKCE